jgi:DNA-directed RNA polymerase specialized sigma24 family protein
MNSYLQENWKQIRKKVQAVTRGHQNTDDLLSDLVMVLLEKPKEYQMNLLENNKVHHWFTSSAQLQFKSKTSPFWYKYKKFQSDTTEIKDWLIYYDEEQEDVKEEIIEFIKKELDLYNIYERTLAIEHILGGQSYSEIGREYGINRRYISETVTPVKQEIFNKVRSKWKNF